MVLFAVNFGSILLNLNFISVSDWLTES